ncbi:glutamine synthetase family protein [Aciditerrimonas ferrireducens]|jgi:glutamine synthetase|uniref:Glutamine synthetase family protein n=1 Tax=Aciditerrimonas ferrireducens TaxID=667306 RepID=A0ABV6C1Q6_9ACTN
MSLPGPPSRTGARGEPLPAALSGVRWVRLCFVDLFGTLRAIHVPAPQVRRVLDHGMVFDGSAIEGRVRLLEADRVLHPDPATAVALPDGSARMLGVVLDAEGEPWPLDPRTALLLWLEAHEELAERWRGGAELEWYLVTADLEPADRGSYFSEQTGLGAQVAHRAAETLEGLGVEVLAAHHEGGPGQWELDLGERDPLGLADALTWAKAVVAETAAAQGLRASFAARPLAGQPGSGLHLHQRLDGLALEGDLAEEARFVIGGLLQHARGLCALAAPSVGSYRRLHSGPEAPGAVVWAHTNRAALVRLGHLADGRPTIEYRGADPTANPYLLLTGLLAAVEDGLANRRFPGKAVEEEPAGLDLAAVEAAPGLLPRSLDAAVDALLEDEVLVDAFDARLVGRLVDGQRAELEAAGANVTRADLLSSLEG